MKILVTGGASRLTQAIVDELAEDHELRLIDSVVLTATPFVESMQGSIFEPDFCAKAVAGVDAVIHTAQPPSDLPEDALERDQALLDVMTRGTHVLFKAAVEAGIKEFLYAGTLAIFSGYPDDVYITELWKPLPSSEMTQMSQYLGEITAREFARDHLITVTCLRLGKLVLEEEVEQVPPELMWLDLRDAAHAFRCALGRDRSQSAWWTDRWEIYHICADIPNPKFLIGTAQRMGYKPHHRFESHDSPAISNS